MKPLRLGDILQELGYINAEQITAALAYQREHRELRLGQALQKLGFVNERQVLEALGRRLNLRIVDFSELTVDVSAVEKIPREVAQKYDMLPIAQSGRALTVAANINPTAHRRALTLSLSTSTDLMLSVALTAFLLKNDPTFLVIYAARSRASRN